MELEEIKKLNLFEKMSLISKEIGAVAKNLEVKITNTRSYKGIAERDVIDAIKPLEVQYRVFSYPALTRIVSQEPTVEFYDSNGNKKVNMFMRIERTYCFVNIDKPSETIVVYSYGDGVDSQDKAPGKALTYADKYALLKAYKISTGDDLDAEASQPTPSAIKFGTTPPAKEEITDSIKAELAELNIPLEKIATYFKKSVDNLTNEECKAIIDKKRKDIAKRG